MDESDESEKSGISDEIQKEQLELKNENGSLKNRVDLARDQTDLGNS